ncbi:methyl-accepting chemotaxis protein [Azospirillum isscasi]|uniref:Methyl-accepting chemotaxis protein n=1 Tax=Azospirillum isscasi TaxID=3053926 RepID=A0ABU0WC61_9PROT|nr:methyl-accepting chemotaxis protein [Azospirillum isscasi]MDQ2101774.1 methyl-accepting chemotaxis protein [Azospirillum isscasi]
MVVKQVIVIVMVTVFALAVGVAALTTKSGSDIEALALKSGEQLGHRYGEMVHARLDNAMEVGRFVATSLVSLKAAGRADREQLSGWLKGVAEANPDFLGVWVGMEPNALDGRDAEFTGKPGSDASGRFIPYWNRASGKVALESLVGYEDPGPDGIYYQAPKRSGRAMVVEPYSYEVAGRKVLMVSMAVPIVENGRVIGVAGVDLSTDGIWSMLKTVKPFDSGSVQLISNDGVWAGHPDAEQMGQPIGKVNPAMDAAKPAIRSGKGFEQVSVAEGQPVKQLFIPVTVIGTQTPWSLLVNLPLDKIDAPVRDLRNATIAGGLVLLAALVAALLIASRSIIGVPLRRTIATLNAVVAGDRSVVIADTDRADEIGAINKALKLFQDNAIRMAGLEEERRREEQRAEERRKRDLAEIASRFEASVGGVVRNVSDQAGEMRSTAQNLSAIATQTDRQAAAVSTAAAEASQNVQTVAAAAEELSCSIREINERIGRSSQMATEAVAEVERTNSTLEGLASAAQKIGDVVNLIQGIAGQTNLLALNATIEAARAGEAGKGFAVVASEVKNLANQTAKATEDISRQIADMQTVSGAVVSVIQAVGRSIIGINETITAIAAAAEQQGAATQEISRNVQQASMGTAAVSTNIGGVTQAAGSTGSMADQALNAAGDLSREADQLRQEVERFVTMIRAA